VVGVQVLFDANVCQVREALVTISTEGTQEAALEELLAKVTSKWASIEFSVIPYKDSKDVYILGAIDEIQVMSSSAEAVLTTTCPSRQATNLCCTSAFP
jgi:dynein heavy chain